MWFKGFLVSVVMSMSTSAWANSPFSPFVIKTVVVHDFGTHILVSSASEISNSESCGSNAMLSLDRQHPFFKEMYAALLLAYQTSNPITGWVNGCSRFGVPNLTRLDMGK